MNILTASKISRSFGEKTILRDASLYLEEGEKVGIIGINGTGKSTLLKMIAGLEESDSGTITRASHLVISFLPAASFISGRTDCYRGSLAEAGRAADQGIQTRSWRQRQSGC